MSKRKGKKYDPHKTIRTMSRFLMRHKVIVCLTTVDDLAVFDYKTMKLHQPDKYLLHALATDRFKWSVECAVLCRRQDGEEYLVTQKVVCEQPYTHAELVGVLNDVHRDLIASCNQLHTLNFGWIAMVSDEDVPLEKQEALYRLLDGFECLTRPEAEKMQN